MAGLEFVDVDKVYKGGHKAVDNLNVYIDDGEFMVPVGPSGCGKTTSLRMIAGLEEISNGKIPPAPTGSDGPGDQRANRRRS